MLMVLACGYQLPKTRHPPARHVSRGQVAAKEPFDRGTQLAQDLADHRCPGEGITGEHD